MENLKYSEIPTYLPYKLCYQNHGQNFQFLMGNFVNPKEICANPFDILRSESIFANMKSFP